MARHALLCPYFLQKCIGLADLACLTAGAEAGLVDNRPALSGQVSEEMKHGWSLLRRGRQEQCSCLPRPPVRYGEHLVPRCTVRQQSCHNQQSLGNNRGLQYLEKTGNILSVLKFLSGPLATIFSIVTKPLSTGIGLVTYLSQRTGFICNLI